MAEPRQRLENAYHELERTSEQLARLLDGYEPAAHDTNEATRLRQFEHQAEPVELGAAADRNVEPVAGVKQLDELERVRSPEPARLGERTALVHPFHEVTQPPRRRRLGRCCRKSLKIHRSPRTLERLPDARAAKEPSEWHTYGMARTRV